MFNIKKITAAIAAICITVTSAFAFMKSDVNAAGHMEICEDIVRVVNRIRAENGLNPVKVYPVANELATVRSEETTNKWGHQRPDGRFANTVLDDARIPYYAFGENLAAAPIYDAEEIVSLWMNSPKHKSTLLGKTYTHIGVGVYEVEGTFYYTQLFLGYIGYKGEYLPEPTHDVILGDVNNDMIIDAADASAVLAFYSDTQSGKELEVTDRFLDAADVNTDGVVDSADASSILTHYSLVCIGGNSAV